VKETITRGTHTAVKSPQEIGKSLLLSGRKKAAASTKFFNGSAEAANYTRRDDGEAEFSPAGKAGRW
jgi:hypothetical protein